MRRESSKTGEISMELIPFALFLTATGLVGFLGTHLIQEGLDWPWLVALVLTACMGISTLYFAALTRSDSHQDRTGISVATTIQASELRQFHAGPGGFGTTFNILIADNSKLITIATRDPNALQLPVPGSETGSDTPVDELVRGLLHVRTASGIPITTSQTLEYGLNVLMPKLQAIDHHAAKKWDLPCPSVIYHTFSATRPGEPGGSLIRSWPALF